MKFEKFVKYNQVELFELWENWIPYKETNKKNEEKEEKVYVVSDEDEEYGFFEMIDYGDHVLSFENFLYCAYENTIP